MNKVHLIDNMEFMKGIPDKYYELAIVDPPYGIDAGNMTGGAGKNKQWKKGKCWDKDIPNEAYFIELSRISKNQIIWGGNYFKLPLTNGWIVWDKGRDKETTFSDGEFAWTNFLNLVRIARIRYDGFLGMDKDGRIHPTQKPVALYKWLLQNYAKPGDKIFDSHVGSGSIRIACHDMGFDFEGCEIDKDYWEAQEKRYNQHAMQGDLFSSEDTQKAIYQGVLF